MRTLLKESKTVALPLLLSLLLQNLINVTDTIFLGRVGEVELGASALAGVFYMAIYYIGFGFGTGVQIMVSRRNGEKRFNFIGGIVGQSFIFLSLLSLLMYVITYWAAPHVMRLFISSNEVYAATIVYLDWRILGLLPSFIAIVFRSFYVGIKNTKILTYSSLIMTVVNVILNYLFIFGYGSIPAMGIKGAAIASSLSEVAGMLVYLLYTLRKDITKYAFFSKRGIDLHIIYRILNVSVWTMLQYFAAVFTWFLFFIAIEHLGERPLAISNVVRSISTLLFSAVAAFGTTASSLAGNALGAGRKGDVIRIGYANILLCAAILLPVMLFSFLFPRWVLSIFSDNPQLIEESVGTLYTMLSYFLITIPGSIIFNVISGTGNTKTAFWIEVLAIGLYATGTYLIIIVMQPPLAYCWLVEHLYWSGMLIASILYLSYARWWERVV